MSDYSNENTGVLFKNDKEGNENRPDYKGKIFFGNEEKQLAAWIKTSKNGQKYMSLSVSEPYNAENKPAQQSEPAQQNTGAPTYDSDVPFANPYKHEYAG